MESLLSPDSFEAERLKNFTLDDFREDKSLESLPSPDSFETAVYTIVAIGTVASTRLSNLVCWLGWGWRRVGRRDVLVRKDKSGSKCRTTIVFWAEIEITRGALHHGIRQKT